MPGPADLRVAGLADALSRLADAREGPLQADPAAAQAAVAGAVGELAREAGLKGSVSPDPRWAEALVAQARVTPHVEALRALAARITAPEAYADEAVRAEVARLEGAMDRDVLKPVGAEFGVGVTAKTQPAKLVADVLAKVSGHKPAKGKAGGKAKAAPPDPALVEEHARRLGDLVARSADPDAVPDAEVEAELARLEGLPKAALVAVATRAGVEGVKAKDAATAILTRVRNRLTAARRARERAEV